LKEPPHEMSRSTDHIFESFYTTYAREMYWVAMALCRDSFMAEEAVQDVFMQLWEKHVDPETIHKPHSYLATLVRNRVLDVMRHRSVVQSHESRVRYEMESESLEGITEEEKEQMIAAAWSLVNSLPESCREIFLMATMEGLKYAEIAEKKGISVNTVKTQLRIARRKIKGNELALVGISLLLQQFL
jgi:RNA polymerase sigma-70 factor (family 1)